MKYSVWALFFLISPFSRAQSPSQPLLSLASSERAFAAATAEVGVRNGFLTFFSDSALAFEPTLGLYKDLLVKRPASSYPLKAILRWAPEEGDVAASGDIGYTTGPYTVESVPPSTDPPPGGWFFSVWKRQTGGEWKVFIDAGIESPVHRIRIDSVIFAPAALHGSNASGGTISDLYAADRNFNAAMLGKSPGIGDALFPGTRVHRNGQFPLKGPNAAAAFLKDMSYSRLTMIAGEISHAGDLGYMYGTYAAAGAHGYYIRIWKLAAPGSWKLVLDTVTEQQ